MQKTSLVALLAGIATLVLIAVSVFAPWWTFSAGQPANTQANFSPVNANLTIQGSAIAIPLVEALNVACMLLLLAGGLAMAFYAVKPHQGYSKRLLDYGYKPPLIVLVLFIVEVVSISLIVQAIGSVSFPLNGAATVVVPAKFTSNNVSTTLNVSAAFQWPFYMGIAVAALAIAAKLTYRKNKTSPPSPSTSQ